MHFLPLLAFAASTLALPNPGNEIRNNDKRGSDKSICAHCMSCYAKSLNAYEVQYKVHVGEPFNDGFGCEAIKVTLKDAVHFTDHDRDWRCKDDGSEQHNTFLQFDTYKGLGQNVSQALNTAFDDAAIRAGALKYDLNCPSH